MFFILVGILVSAGMKFSNWLKNIDITPLIEESKKQYSRGRQMMDDFKKKRS